MQVAVKNNSLNQTADLIGTAYTGAIVAGLISCVPWQISAADRATLQISLEFGSGNVRIKFAFSETRVCFSQLELPRGAMAVQSIIESRALIHGLIFFVLGIMPTQTDPPFFFREVLEATAMGLLFDWEDRPTPLIRKRSFSFDAIDLSLIEQYMYAIATTTATATSPGFVALDWTPVTPPDAKEIDALLKEAAEEECEVESNYRRRLDI